MKHNYKLNPDIIFLNHGSFGAVPKEVFSVYHFWQHWIEQQPVAFFQNHANRLLGEARKILGHYLHADAGDLVFVTNATMGVNIIAHSMSLGPDDEILTTNAEYGALDRTWRFLSQKRGFQIRRHTLELPFTTPADFVDSFLADVTPKTRLVYISHILSALSTILPVEEICHQCRKRDILTLVDGAHAPGQIPLNLAQIDADFYVGNLHKWLSAPRGAGFLYSRPSAQPLVEPLIISWGWESPEPSPSRYIDWLQYTGTRDLSAFLSVPAAITFQNLNAFEDRQKQAHHLAQYVLNEIGRITGLAPFYQPNSDWFAQMVSIPLPTYLNPKVLHDQLLEEGIEVVILTWESHCILRVSIQAYNTKKDIKQLIYTIKDKITKGERKWKSH